MPELEEMPRLGPLESQLYEGFFDLLTPVGMGGVHLPYRDVSDFLDRNGFRADLGEAMRGVLRAALSHYRELNQRHTEEASVN